MATLNSLKRELRQKALATIPHTTQTLSDTQYSAGLDILIQNSGRAIYEEFITPQLRLLLAPLCYSRSHISVLEIGPGAKSVLGSMPSCVRRKITNYAAFEPNHLFAIHLEEWLCSTSETGLPLPCLESHPKIHRVQFSSDSDGLTGSGTSANCAAEKFDVILFCHSMYGMQPKRKFIERALQMMKKRPEGGMVIVFHRNGELHFDGLTCHQTASFPTGIIDVADNNEALDLFAPFIAGFVMQDAHADQRIRIEWREVCRALGRHDDSRPGRLLYSAPNIMAVFNQHATALPELTAHVPLARGESKIKNREARLHRPASALRPTEIRHIQDCVRWAFNHGVSLTVIGGGHSGHCIWPNVVAVDMRAFTNVHILHSGKEIGARNSNTGSLVVAEAGCTSGDIVRKTMAAGLIVPMGARPSVGAGLWLQGGIGHLSRLHGLTCDAIVGAVMVSVASSKAFYLGQVPTQYRPPGAMRPESEDDLLWALKGAGTNFGIVVSVTFKAYPAPTFSIHNWVLSLNSNLEAQAKLSEFIEVVAADLPRNCSADAYLYWDRDKLHLGVTMFESSANLQLTTPALAPASAAAASILGPQNDVKTLDSVGLFESEMYVSGMHGGHGGGKTSSFKRCLFLKRSGILNIIDILVAAIEARPSPLCYFHLLQGGGAVGDVAHDATAFGCRDWDFACVITGVWPRNQDGLEVERAAVQWVYNVVRDLLPLSSGAYGADLGPDPRDTALAAKAFGPNRPRLSHLKHSWDPSNVLAHACPLLEVPIGQKLIVLVTGESCAGKDFCADIWVSMFATHSHESLKACSVSISDAMKKEYAAATGADVERLLSDRAYKEKHRSALSTYFREQIRKRPRLPEANFLDVVHATADMDVLFVTGMRDEAPVATFSHLVPDSRLLEVRVNASMSTREARRGCQGGDGDTDDHKNSIVSPCLVFNNDKTGPKAAKTFCKDYLLPFFHEDMERLASMVRSVPDFPRPGVEFRHVLDITQQVGGLALCTSLLQQHFIGACANVTVVACCEVGGFVYASALAARVGVPLALIREAGKLPPPTISVMKPRSHISSATSNDLSGKRIEMGRNVIPRGASVLVVDDVLATGETLCAVLQLLGEAGVGAEDVNVMVVAEFPLHRGRELLRCRGFGRARIQSLLIFGGP